MALQSTAKPSGFALEIFDPSPRGSEFLAVSGPEFVDEPLVLAAGDEIGERGRGRRKPSGLRLASLVETSGSEHQKLVPPT